MELTPKEKPFQKLLRWARLHKSGLLFGTAIGLIGVVGIGLLAWMQFQPVPEPLEQPKAAQKAPEAPKYYSPLTGVEVPDDATTKRQVTAIMIENSPDARPQSGLKQAGIVYEAVAEGGITRFQALYQEAQPGLIGPVRSLRPYYLEWAAPYDPAFAHIGGSARALETVRSGAYKDIDQFFNPRAYWRASDRYAPHNVYTSFERLNALNQAKGFTGSSFTGFERKKDEPAAQPNATSITVPISGGLYNSSYTYDKANNSYVRFQGGQPHTDREEGQITPKVVIVLRVLTSIGFEDGYREQITTTGSGDAFIFQDGTVTQGRWSKQDIKSPLQLVTAEGTPIKLNAGQTWITAVSTSRTPTWQ